MPKELTDEERKKLFKRLNKYDYREYKYKDGQIYQVIHSAQPISDEEAEFRLTCLKAKRRPSDG